MTALTHTLDDTKINKTHFKMVLTAGMGFFTDAYDLFIIGVVTSLLAPIWHLTTTQLALLNGASLAAAALGAISFGYLSDKFGRKKMYGYEIFLLIIGSVLSACSANFIILLIARLIVGFGIGGDYPSSAVVASEYANRKNRGFIVLLVFAMQAVGLLVGPMLASLLLYLNIPHELVWRLLLAFGAIPATYAFYLRRRLQETPQYMDYKNSPTNVSRVVSDLIGYREKANPNTQAPNLLQWQWLKYLIITASAWFLLDVVFYGNGISIMMIMKSMNPSGDLLSHTLIAALLFLVFAVPGYALSAKTIDTLGRKAIQIMGFAMIALCYISLGYFAIQPVMMNVFILLFGLSFLFTNFGPNATTFLIPSELFPTPIRARAHGISAAIGKLGAFVGAFGMPLILHAMGLSQTFYLLSGVALLGVIITLGLPEMKQKALR